MAANVVKLVNNTKAILKVDDRVDEGSKHFVTSGAVDTAITTAKNDIIGDASEDYNTLGKIEGALPEYYTFYITYDISTTPPTPEVILDSLDVDGIMEAALAGKNVILKESQGGIFYLTDVDEDTATTTILWFMSLANGYIKQLKIKRTSVEDSAVYTQFDLS